MQAHCWRHWVTAKATSSPSHEPVLPTPGSWEYIQTTTSSMHSSLFWSLCTLERSCLPQSVHPWVMPPKPACAVQWAPAITKAAAPVRLLGFGEGWGELAIQKPRCNHSAPPPAAQESPSEAAPVTQGEHQPGRAHWEMCQSCWGHFQVRRTSGCLSLGYPVPSAG